MIDLDTDATPTGDLDLDAALALIPRPRGDGVPRFGEGGDFDNAPDPYLAARLRELPSWATAPSPPASVVTARKALDDACQRLEQATESALQIAADQDAEARARDVAIEKAVVVGKSPTPPAGTDWDDEQKVRLARHRIATRDALAAQSALHRALREALPGWRAALVGQIADQHAATAKAMQGLTAARTQWRATVAGAAALAEAQTGHVVPMPVHVSRVIAAANEGQVALAAELADNHPGVTGAWLADDSDLSPSRIEREAMHETEQGLMVLMHLEEGEGYRRTQFTLGLARTQGRAAAAMLDQSRAEIGANWW